MAVYKQKGSSKWWYKFAWRGVVIRESTRQTNKRVAEQMEAARKTALAKGEVGIRDRKPTPTLREFAERDFLPFIRATFAEKRNTRRYYEVGARALLSFEKMAKVRLDAITGEAIAGYVSKRQQDGLEVSSINRELQVLRRMFALAQEWEKTTKALPRVRMVPGEAHRERVLSADEEQRYFDAATALGEGILQAYERALSGIRATQRGEQPIKPQDPFRLRDAAMILMDCGLRPEECFRLRWADVRDGALYILSGKTENARRKIPLSTRLQAILDMRREVTGSEWVFPAPTRSGHIEPSSLKKPHHKACKAAKLEPIPLYTFRHTCLTRWAASGMDPWTLAHLAGHGDMSITRRYVHPQEHTIREALEKARAAKPEGTASEERGGHSIGHSDDSAAPNHSGRETVIN
jgi:integrase